MNWTGGSLQRTKRPKTGVMQQQKAYFAKARTYLQNGTNPPVAPFRPSYLRDNTESDLIGGMGPFGSGSIRHIGHSAKQRGESARYEASLDGKRLAIDQGQRPSHVSRHPSARPDVQRYPHQEPRGEKRKAGDKNEETRLLEANKRRLLTQQDWVGIDPSKPVNLRFLSSKEKDKIGKRRRITGKRGAALRQDNVERLREGQLHPTNEGFAGPFERINNIDSIRIRVGTDALTNTYSAQTNEHVQSEASSDSMLFDQEGPDAQQHAEKLDIAPPVNSSPREATSMSRQTSATSPARLLTGEKTRRYHDVTRLREPIAFGDASDQGSSAYDQLELHIQDATSIHQERGSSAAGFRLTHCVEGNQRALHLFFGGSQSSAGSRARIVSGNSGIGETLLPRAPSSTQASQIGQMHQTRNDSEQSAVDEASAALAIVDEEPWRTYLAISDGGLSHSDTANEARNSMLHGHPTARNNNEAATNWSQHATKGDQSRISPSSISASLPSLKRGVKKPISAHPYGGHVTHRGDPVDMRRQILDEDGRNWQAFVFGSDKNSSSQTTHDREAGILRQKYSDNTSSRYLPMSAAVSTVSRPPRDTRFGSYISDGVQDSDTFASPFRSRATSPPAFHGFVEEMSDGGYGEDIDERNVLDVHSLTHASLQNNAPASSGMFSGTKASRSSLEQLKSARDASYTKGTSSRRFAGSSSIYDIPVSDDEADHLLDPDETSWG